MIISVLREFSKNNVDYCCWKGLSKIDNALNGLGDVDLYIPLESKELANTVLLRCGFFEAVPTVSYQEISHFFFVGGNSTFHIHVYWEIRTGSSTYKDYIIDSNDSILSNLQDVNGVKCVNDKVAKDLNIIRKWMKKSSFFGRVFLLLQRKKYLSEDDYLETNIIENYESQIVVLIEEYNVKKISKLSSFFAFWNILIRLFKSRILKHRRRLVLGKVVSIIGSDGSGKSTLLNSISLRYSTVCSTRVLRFGRPSFTYLSSPIFILRNLKFFIKIIKEKLSSKAVVLGDSQISKDKRISFVKALSYCLLAIERYCVVGRARRLALSGLLVFMDRGPAVNNLSFDSANISLNSVGLVRWLGSFERKVYENIKELDLALILDVSENEALIRNQSRTKYLKESDDEIKERIKQFRRFQPKAQVKATLNADMNKFDVLDSACMYVNRNL